MGNFTPARFRGSKRTKRRAIQELYDGFCVKNKENKGCCHQFVGWVGGSKEKHVVHNKVEPTLPPFGGAA